MPAADRPMKAHPRHFLRRGLPLAALLTAAYTGVQPAAAALVSHWALNENNGITAMDSGPAGNTGTLTNLGTGTIGWTNGISGSAVALTGVAYPALTNGGFVEIGNRASLNFEVTNTFSISAWMKTTNTSQDSTIVGKMLHGSFSGPYLGYELHYQPNQIVAWLFNTDGSLYVYSSNSISDGNWHHVAFAYNGSGLASGVSIYVDGILKSATIVSDTLGTNSTIRNTVGFNIGSRQDGTTHNFTGSIDDVQVYNHALTPAEMLSLYQNPGNSAVSPTPAPRVYHTATLLPNGKVLIAGGETRTVGAGNFLATAQLYDPTTGTWTTISPMNNAHYYHTATLLPNGKVLVAGGIGSGGVINVTEVYDPASGTWTVVGSMGAARRHHTATLLSNGKVLVAGGFDGTNILSSAELFDPASGTWTNTGQMNVPHISHTATLLPNGRVLVAGGFAPADPAVAIKTAELYDPATGVWTSVNNLATARYIHTATLLPNGKVLVAGGYNAINGDLASVELFDPATGTWANTGAMSVARDNPTASLLPNGKVLIAGGEGDFTSLGGLELFDPAKGTWTTVGSLSIARWSHTATMLPNGKVMFVGGFSTNSTVVTNAEFYSQTNGAWTNAGSLNTARKSHTATLLSNGKVLVAGGWNGPSQPLASGEVYDPATGTWTTNAMTTAHAGHAATLLPNGTVLVTGGWTNIASAELFDPTARTWRATGPLHTGRHNHTSTLLRNGKVLVAGGYNVINGYLASVELFDPASETWTIIGGLNTARAYHTATLLPGGKVLVAGGFNSTNGLIASAELYDSASGVWAATGPLHTARYGATATLLPNGKVLVAGGSVSSLYIISTNNAELYDPTTGLWTPTGSMVNGRTIHTATLLANGTVLVTGGFDNSSSLSSAEVYDPSLGRWSPVNALANKRGEQTATLLANGKGLVVGGYNYTTGAALSSVEIYDVGLGFSNSWQPQISAATSPLNLGSSLVVTGSQFRGVSEGSFGNTQDSSADYPVVQLRSLNNEQTLPLLATAWSTNSYTSVPVTDFPPGWAMATMFVNGIPSTSSILLVISNQIPAIVTLSNLNQTYDGTAKSVSVTTIPTNLTVGITYNGLSNAPTNAGNYTVVGTVNDPNYQGSATNTLAIGKATGAVSFANLSPTYDGTAKSVTVTTVPTNLTVNITYNGTTGAPTNAGSYTVVGTINDANYQGSTTNTLVIGKATGTVTFGSLSPTYDGTAKNVTVTTVPKNLAVNVTYNGTISVPTNAGNYTVIGTISDPNYQGSATNTLVIGKAMGAVAFGNLSPTYDGAAKNVTVTTVPTNLAVNVTYNGTTSAPTNAGSYAVIGTINNANYQGSATNTLVIGKATGAVMFANLAQIYDGTPKSVTLTTVPTNLMVSVTYNGASSAPTNAGSYMVAGTINDANYQGSATNTLVIGKAAGTVTFGNLSPTYDGAASSVSVTTIPTNLIVNVTYNGMASAPTNAGSYTVVGTINDANYQGSTTNTLVIGNATGTVMFTNLAQIFDGTAKSVSVSTVPAGLAVNVTYNGATNPPANEGSYIVVGTISNLNYQGVATNTLVISLPAVQAFTNLWPYRLQAITTDGTNLYVVGTSSSGSSANPTNYVFSVSLPLSTGSVVRAIYTNVDAGTSLYGLTVHGTNLFWIDPLGGPLSFTVIFDGANSGSPVSQFDPATIVNGGDITSDGRQLFATDLYGGSVTRLGFDFSGETKIGALRYTSSFSAEHLNTLTAGNGVVYVADAGKSEVITPQVVSIATDGGSYTTLAAGAPLVNLAGIAMSGGALFVVDIGTTNVNAGVTNTIWELPISGGAPTVLMSGPPFRVLNRITYWNHALYATDNDTNNANGIIFQIPLVTTVPAFGNVSILTNQVTLNWSAPIYEQFQVRWTTNLASVNWHVFPNIITSATTNFSFLDTNTPLLVKFYSLLLLP